MKSFKPLRVTKFGVAAGISSPYSNKNAGAQFGINDVVVCEYSDLHRLKKDDFYRFQSVIIDSRYPQGFVGSRWPSSYDGKVGEGPSLTATVSPELISEAWWENLVEMLGKSSFNCMLIENPGPSVFVADSLERSEMQRVELIALRAAFVLGANLFASPDSSVKKRILTWARRKTKETTKSTTNKVKDVQELLLHLLRPFRFDASGEGYLEQISHTSGKRLDLEIRPCSLSDSDKADYDSCCTAVRGALSLFIDKAGESTAMLEQNHRAIAGSLLSLRRHCFHSNISELFMSTSFRARLGQCFPNRFAASVTGADDTRILCRKVNDNASQTDLDLASRILEGSPKLRELVTILRNECEYRIECENAIAPFLEPEKSRRAKHATDPKKVVILAVLPEVQIILSVLLNCLGLAHELLMRPSRFFISSENDITIDLPEKQAYASTLAWIECQQALSRFNCASTSTTMVPLNLVIASPEMLSGDHGGIGVDLADFVISMDEDWSGRNELIMRSFVAALIPRNLRVKDKGCQLLKLVCEGTCEESFLSDGPDEDALPLQPKAEAASWPWPLDMFGRFATSNLVAGQQPTLCWPEREHNEALFAFPALNLFRFRNQSLSEVLGVENMPPPLQHGSALLFLPEDAPLDGDDNAGHRTAEIGLLKSVMETEDSARSKFQENGCYTSCPSPSLGNAVTRQDVHTLASRIQLELLCKSMDADAISDQDKAKLLLPAARSSASARIPASSFVETSDTADGSENPDSGAVPVVAASSLLLYGKGMHVKKLSKSDLENPARSKDGRNGATKDNERILSTRRNNFASAFHTCHQIIRDGNQGSEPLVYFPPLFPRLLQCSVQAKLEIGAVLAKNAQKASGHGLMASSGSVKASELKRQADSSEGHAAKRPKIEAVVLPSTVHPPLLPHAATASVDTDDEASQSDASKILLELDEDFGLVGLGAIPLPTDAVKASAKTAIEVPKQALDADQILMQTEGLELLPPESSEELDIVRTSGHIGSLNAVILFIKRKRRQFSGALAVYRPAPAPADVGWPIPSGLPGRDVSVPQPGNGVFHDVNGMHTSAKKIKKKAVTPGASAAFPRPAGDRAPPHAMAQQPMNIQMVKSKDMYRSRIVAFLSARQKALGMSLFESPAFSFAALRFRNLFNDRARRLSWAAYPSQKIGPGLPMIPESSYTDYSGLETTQWTSIVKRLKTEASRTGDDARALAETQRSTLRRSLSAPTRVDFGPFHCGFLLSLTGMTGISPPRSRSGVSLPMGVKVPLVGEQQQRLWSDNEDQTLRESSRRYGMNWILASRLLGGFDDVVVPSDQAPTHRRSARFCRDRWQTLARNDPALAKDVQLSERRLRESSLLRASAVAAESDPVILLGGKRKENGAPETTTDSRLELNFIIAENWNKQLDSLEGEAKGLDQKKEISDEDQKKEISDEDQKKEVAELDRMELDIDNIHIDDSMAMDCDQPSKSDDLMASAMQAMSTEATEIKKPFGFLMSARSRRQAVPLTIPGVVPGSQPSFVASHPSHHQCVQSSVAATWTNGRTEMWPLQFLDVAEKQRSASSTETKTSPRSVAKPTSTTRSPSGARAATSHSGRAPASSSSSRAPGTSSRTSSTAARATVSRAQAVPASAGRTAPSTAPGGHRAPSAVTGTPRTSSSTARAPVSSNSARTQVGSRPHPVAPSNASHSRNHKPGTYTPMKYPHPQGSAQHYAPPPGAHPVAHAGSPHQPNYHHHQRLVPSPASRSPRAAAPQPQPPAYVTHTPLTHSQNMHDSTKARTAPAPSPRTSSSKSPAGHPTSTISTSTPPKQQASPSQQPKPK